MSRGLGDVYKRQIYNGYGIGNKSWNKKIKANELDKEKELLNRLDGVNIKIINKELKVKGN